MLGGPWPDWGILKVRVKLRIETEQWTILVNRQSLHSSSISQPVQQSTHCQPWEIRPCQKQFWVFWKTQTQSHRSHTFSLSKDYSCLLNVVYFTLDFLDLFCQDLLFHLILRSLPFVSQIIKPVKKYRYLSLNNSKCKKESRICSPPQSRQLLSVLQRFTDGQEGNTAWHPWLCNKSPRSTCYTVWKASETRDSVIQLRGFP